MVNTIPAPDSHQTALIVEGGAMRSVFSAGLLDGLIEQDFAPFDFYIGVSAGASNIVAFLAGIPGKSLQIFQDFASSKKFINYTRFAFGGHLIDLDWLSDIIFSDSHLGSNLICLDAKPLFIGVTEVNTGKAHYIKATKENIENTIKASTALPYLYREFPEINNSPMTDGGVAQGIPIAEAIRMGAKRIMVIRSRQKQYLKKDTLGHKFIRWKMRKYPALIKIMQERVEIHQKSINLLRNPPADVKIVEVCPADHFQSGRFNQNKMQLLQGYQHGLETANSAIEQWQSILTIT